MKLSEYLCAHRKPYSGNSDHSALVEEVLKNSRSLGIPTVDRAYKAVDFRNDANVSIDLVVESGPKVYLIETKVIRGSSKHSLPNAKKRIRLQLRTARGFIQKEFGTTVSIRGAYSFKGKKGFTPYKPT